jgi:hypothetical protein
VTRKYQRRAGSRRPGRPVGVCNQNVGEHLPVRTYYARRETSRQIVRVQMRGDELLDCTPVDRVPKGAVLL